MNWDDVCLELIFHDTSAKAYRKCWQPNKKLVVDPLGVGRLVLTLNGCRTEHSITQEDRNATDWCIECS
jgi:hypothetical protein